MNIKIIISSLLILIFASCTKDEPIIEKPESSGVDIFGEYIDRFFNEAQKRGYYLNRATLDVTRGATIDEYCGLGYHNYFNTGGNKVFISPNANCWEERTDIEKEILMFHELGHAVLDRNHDQTKLPNTMPRSIMCSSEFCATFGMYSQYSPLLRKFYLDELFNTLTPTPDWAHPKTKSTILFSHDFENENYDWLPTEIESGDTTLFTSQRETIPGTDNYGLKITSNTIAENNRDFAFWRLTIPKPNFPEASSLRITSKITTDGVKGSGVSLVIRADSGIGDERVLSGFITTQGKKEIIGNLKSEEFSTTLLYMPSEVEQLNVYLILLNNTEGTVYFDDVIVELFE